MRINNFYWSQNLLLAISFFFLLPAATIAGEIFGGLTFLGDRQGICIEIDGDCVKEDIHFVLATCDTKNVEKQKFKERLPFTIRVPKGTHKLVIRKNGKPFITDEITIEAEKVLEYQLP